MSIERILRTIKLLAKVTKASRGKMRTAPIACVSRAMDSAARFCLTYCQPVGAKSHGIIVAVMKTISSRDQVDEVDEHEDEVESVDQGAAED